MTAILSQPGPFPSTVAGNKGISPGDESQYSLRLACGPRDLRAVQHLRYQVFVRELGADVPKADHEAELERDAFDPHVDHLLLIDNRADPESLGAVVGVYRLLPPERVAMAGGYYCASEFDLTPLLSSGRRLLELGRSCVHPDHRGGAGLYLLWQGLANFVLEREIEVLFGAASFHGVDAAALAQPLAWLQRHHLAPEPLRVVPLAEGRLAMNLAPPERLNRAKAQAAMPALIRAYLRLGGFVSDGAFIDRAFNTIDVCLVMDTAQMSEKHRAFYARKSGREA
jgi:putative hemolysin